MASTRRRAASPPAQLPSISPAQLRYHRLVQNGLLQPFAGPEEAASALVGVQAQILPAAALALWNRTTGLSAAQVDDLLYSQRALVKLWGQRNTLHLYAARDWPLLHAARSLDRTWWEEKAARAGESPEVRRALVERVAAALRERASLGRSDLRAPEWGIEDADLLSPWGGIFADLVHLGIACHAGRGDGEGRFAHRERWLPDLVWEPPSAHDANLTVARRFFAAYGPATLQDYIYWRGIRQATARAWLHELEQELVEVAYQEQRLLLLRAHLPRLLASPPEAEAWPVRLLYRFDPYLLAHRDKAWVVAPEHYTQVWRPAGHIEGILLAHGCGAGIWRYERQSRGLVIQVRPFAPLPAYVAQQLPHLAAGVATFFGQPLVDLTVTALD